MTGPEYIQSPIKRLAHASVVCQPLPAFPGDGCVGTGCGFLLKQQAQCTKTEHTLSELFKIPTLPGHKDVRADAVL